MRLFLYGRPGRALKITGLVAAVGMCDKGSWRCLSDRAVFVPARGLFVARLEGIQLLSAPHPFLFFRRPGVAVDFLILGVLVKYHNGLVTGNNADEDVFVKEVILAAPDAEVCEVRMVCPRVGGYREPVVSEPRVPNVVKQSDSPGVVDELIPFDYGAGYAAITEGTVEVDTHSGVVLYNIIPNDVVTGSFAEVVAYVDAVDIFWAKAYLSRHVASLPACAVELYIVIDYQVVVGADDEYACELIVVYVVVSYRCIGPVYLYAFIAAADFEPLDRGFGGVYLDPISRPVARDDDRLMAGVVFKYYPGFRYIDLASIDAVFYTYRASRPGAVECALNGAAVDHDVAGPGKGYSGKGRVIGRVFPDGFITRKVPGDG